MHLNYVNRPPLGSKKHPILYSEASHIQFSFCNPCDIFKASEEDINKIVKTYVDSPTVPESKSKICLGNKFHQDCEFRSSNQTLWGRITL